MPRRGEKILSRALFDALPADDELILAPKVRKVLVELALEDVGIRERQATIIEGRENPKRRVLALRLDGEQNHIVENAGGKVNGIGRPLVNELGDLPLKEGEVASVSASPTLLDVTGAKDGKELTFVIVGGNLRIDLETIGVRFIKLVGLPHALGNGGASLHRLLVLHVGKLVIEGAEKEHDGRKALLTVNDLELPVVVLEGNDGAEEVLVGLAVELLVIVIGEGEGEEVIP